MGFFINLFSRVCTEYPACFVILYPAEYRIWQTGYQAKYASGATLLFIPDKFLLVFIRPSKDRNRAAVVIKYLHI